MISLEQQYYDRVADRDSMMRRSARINVPEPVAFEVAETLPMAALDRGRLLSRHCVQSAGISLDAEYPNPPDE